MIFIVILIAALLMILGFEVFLVLGIPTLFAKNIFYDGIPNLGLIQQLVGGIDHTTLLAIPFFIFAAHLMASGQIAKRLTNLVNLVVGHRRGGVGHTVIGGSMAFGSVSGSAPATVAALGKLLYPQLIKSGYRKPML